MIIVKDIRYFETVEQIYFVYVLDLYGIYFCLNK